MARVQSSRAAGSNSSILFFDDHAGYNGIEPSFGNRFMLEARTFEGTSEELSGFVLKVWRASYQGIMPIPLWSGGYFDWQLGLPDEPRDHLVAAYDGTNLVGTILGFPMSFHTPRGLQRGTQGSWLSVAEDYRRQGVGSLLRQEMLRVHREHQLAFQIGYGFIGSKWSLGPKFWGSRKREGSAMVRPSRMWARVLRPRLVADFSLNRWEGMAARYLAPFNPIAKPANSGLEHRGYQPSDQARVAQLLESSQYDLAIEWTAETLNRQLQRSPIPRTIVASRNEDLQGVISYHILPFQGRTEINVAIVDLLVTGNMSAYAARQLVWSGLCQMQNEGAAIVLFRVTENTALRVLLETGFVPRSIDSSLVISWADQPQEWGKLRKMRLLWR